MRWSGRPGPTLISSGGLMQTGETIISVQKMDELESGQMVISSGESMQTGGTKTRLSTWVRFGSGTVVF